MHAPVTDKREIARGPDEHPVGLPRAQGRLQLSFKRRDEKTVLDGLYQQGCLKARFPKRERVADCEAVLINTAGGLTDGDRLQQTVCWGERTKAQVTSQAAERIYRSRRGVAKIDTQLNTAVGATAIWLPQETILFDGGRFERSNTVELALGSRLIATESLVFGRQAMKEDVRDGCVRENWRIRYDGSLVFADGFHLAGDIAGHLARPGVAGTARAIATLLYVGEDAVKFVSPMKACAEHISNQKVKAGCSQLPNVLVTRVLATSGSYMRTALMALMRELMREEDREEMGDLPRVWLC